MNPDPFNFNNSNGAPPLPPRPMGSGLGYQNTGYGGYNSFGMGGFGYGGGLYGNGYYNNGFGGYGTGYNNFGMGASPESNFVRIAEEQSRGAFQSIESVVNAVASVANMLSSTHNAVFSSFRAVIGVVEQFSLLKAQVGGFFFVTLVRWLRWLWRTLLVHLGLKPANYNNQELIWTDIQSSNPTAAEYLPGGHHQVGFNWAAAIFWMIALGGPYLIYKAVSKMVANVEESRKWATGDRDHYCAQALYDFNGASSQELSFRKDDKLRVAPKSEQPQVRGWLLASSDDGQRVGLVPINYVKILSRQSASPPVVPRNPLDESSPRASPMITVTQADRERAAMSFVHNPTPTGQSFDDFFKIHK